mgnify:CR=1 FL=1
MTTIPFAPSPFMLISSLAANAKVTETIKIKKDRNLSKTLINAINTQITSFNNNSTTKLSGKCELLIRSNFFHVNFNLTILRKYLPKDFVVVFFDNVILSHLLF